MNRIMELKELQDYFKSFPDGTTFNYSLSKPFSWRGSYDEVAFSITETPMTKEQILENILLAYTEEFYGYKGGKYRYFGYTTVHFESDYGSWSDGHYVSSLLAKIENTRLFNSQEERLVNLAFR